MMYSVCVAVEECGEWKKLRKVFCYDVEEFGVEDGVKLVGETKKTAAWVGDWCACWGASMSFSIVSCIALTVNDVPSGMPTA